MHVIRQLQPSGAIALHQPDLTGNEAAYTQDAIHTGWVSSVGRYVDLFEEKLMQFTGAAKAVAVVNGTCGLHLALHLVNVEKNSEVLTPALTFVGTTNAIIHAGAIPHFVDSAQDNMAICPKKLDEYLNNITDIQQGKLINKNTGRTISALIIVHVLGSSADTQGLSRVAKKYHLKIIEDAAEALGSFQHNQHLGLNSDLAVISFNGNKIVTTGAGGALISRDLNLMERAKHLSTTAKSSADGFFFHDAVGFNFRMANINAAIGVAQLERLAEFLRLKKNLSAYYRQQFSAHDAIEFINPDAGANCWLSAIKIPSANDTILKKYLDVAQSQQIMLRPIWVLNNQLPMYRDCPSMDCINAVSWVNRVLCLPSSAYLGAKL